MDARFFQRSYDRFAPQYDQVFLTQQRPKIMALMAAVGPHDGLRLDAGCGTCLAQRVTGLPFIGLDASGEMLRQGLGCRVQGDLYRLPFAAGIFSLVFSVTALIDFGDPAPALDEMLRVLRPDGVLALSVLKHENVSALDAALPGAERIDLFQDVGYVLRRSRA